VITATGTSDGLVQVSLSRFPEAQIKARFKAAIDRANTRVAVDLKKALDDAMRSPAWSTKDGQADIFETGELLQSGTVTINSSGVTIAYDAPYAALVHYGGYINPYGSTTEKVYLPPRPWVESVLKGGNGIKAFDFARYYEEEILKEFR
jgi:phage gpG-like protein